MGTRSVITFAENGVPICAVYQQFDGYIEGVGKELKDFLKSKPFVNGIGDDEDVFNGAGCCIAQFIAKFKTRAGGLYVTKIGSGEEFNYFVDFIHGKDDWCITKVKVTCEGYGEQDEKDYAEVIKSKKPKATRRYK